ncbi:MAG: NADH-quinone oxidoreductase subunit N [Thermosulfidibacteraceae bacterium]|jgi:NADH-quinone oxidoreductase subunit N
MVEIKDLLAILPEITVLLTALVVLIVDSGQGRKGYGNIIAFIGFLCAGIVSLFVENSGRAFSGTLARDGLTFVSNLLFIFCGAVTTLYARDYLLREDRHYGEFYGLVALAVCSMMLLASSMNILLFFLNLEILSICLYALSGFTRERDASVEAAIKYFIIGAFSATFTALGMALMLYSAGSLDIEVLAKEKTTLIFSISVALLLVSILFKMSAAPFHIWAPDVYQGAPSPSTGFMMTAGKAAIFIFTIRLLNSIAEDIWYILIFAASVTSMLIGNITAIRQTDVKRILAYSSIAHAGYILMGYLAGGKEGVAAIVFYAIAYSIMNLGSFAVLSVIGGRNEINTDLESLSGLATRQPLLAFILSAFLFSLTGIPGTIGFSAKFYLFSIALKKGLWALVVFALINSAIAAYYYLKVVYSMFMRDPRAESYEMTVGPFTGIVLFLLSILVVIVGVIPEAVFNVVVAAIK